MCVVYGNLWFSDSRYGVDLTCVSISLSLLPDIERNMTHGFTIRSIFLVTIRTTTATLVVVGAVETETATTIPNATTEGGDHRDITMTTAADTEAAAATDTKMYLCYLCFRFVFLLLFLLLLSPFWSCFFVCVEDLFMFFSWNKCIILSVTKSSDFIFWKRHNTVTKSNS